MLVPVATAGGVYAAGSLLAMPPLPMTLASGVPPGLPFLIQSNLALVNFFRNINSLLLPGVYYRKVLTYSAFQSFPVDLDFML